MTGSAVAPGLALRRHLEDAMPHAPADRPPPPLRDQVIGILKDQGVGRRPGELVVLSSGKQSDVFVDVKRALARWTDLQVAAEAICDETRRAGCDFNAVGGLTMGADAIAIAVACAQKAQWFSVRKEPKTHGLKQIIEGARLGAGDRVLLVDDAVTTGGSILRAYEEVVKTGAQVVAASALVDRGGHAAEQFADRGVEYLPVATFEDLGLDPV